MKFKVSLVGLATIAACCVVTASAPAHEFLGYECEKIGPGKAFTDEVQCLEPGTGTGGEWERVGVPAIEVEGVGKEQGFEIPGAIVVCMESSFETSGSIASPTTSLTLRPQYKSCTVELGGPRSATVNTTGCDFDIHAAAPNTAAEVDIQCVSGKELLITVGGITGCTIKIPPQTGLKKLEYTNKTDAIEVHAQVTGIQWSATSACGLKELSGSNGKYGEGTLTGGFTGNAALMVLEAFVGLSEKGFLVE